MEGKHQRYKKVSQCVDMLLQKIYIMLKLFHV